MPGQALKDRDSDPSGHESAPSSHARPRRLPGVMPNLRATAAIFASGAIAMTLSVGAALAQNHPSTADIAAGQAKAPAGLCILHDIGLKN